MREGLLNLINKGKIPKGMDMNQVFFGSENPNTMSRALKYKN